MQYESAKEVFIWGITQDGQTFRPSDWAERLAGVMSHFGPGSTQATSHLFYSPWCMPLGSNGVKCLVVNGALRDQEPQAWRFVLGFAADNNLQVTAAGAPPAQEKAPDRRVRGDVLV